MFYTKYRPQKFSDVLAPNKAADALATQVKNGKTVHAYLFVGPRGIGKTTMARILAKALNCEKINKKTGNPCDKCVACEAIKKGSFIDLIEIDAASNRGIDDIRDLKDKIRLAPTQGKRKVYIIDEVHMLTNEAFNALLKTLEEPPANTTLILCTTEFHKVPETIRSRCQVFKLKRASVAQLVSKLKTIAKEEGIKISEAELKKIARASLGGFRDAETMLQQVAEGGIDVETLLNTGSKETYIEFTGALHAKDVGKGIHLVNKVVDDGVDLHVWVGELLRYLREVLFVASGVSLSDLGVDFGLTEELEEDITSQATLLEISWIVGAIDLFLEVHNEIKSASIHQLPLEIAIVRICGLSDGVSTSVTGSSPNTSNGGGDGLNVVHLKPSKLSGSKKASLSSEPQEPAAMLEDSPTFDFDEVSGQWTQIVKVVAESNGSTTALIKAGKPLRAEGRFLILEVAYAFHKERLESPKNRTIVEKALNNVCDKDIRIRCEVNGKNRAKKKKDGESGVLTDKNVVVPVDTNAVIDMLDGGLPL